MSLQGPETPNGGGEVVFSGLLLQVETIRAQLGIEAKGAVAILSEANSLIGLPSEGTMPQQAAALLQALGRPPSPSEHLEPEMVSQRVSRARSINASKKSLMMGLEAGGVTRPRPQHFSKDAGTNAVRVAYEGQALHAALRSLREQLQTREASPSYLVSLKLVVGADAVVAVRLASSDDWRAPVMRSIVAAETALAAGVDTAAAAASSSSACGGSAADPGESSVSNAPIQREDSAHVMAAAVSTAAQTLEVLHAERTGLATMLQQVQRERDVMREELRNRAALSNIPSPSAAGMLVPFPAGRGSTGWQTPPSSGGGHAPAAAVPPSPTREQVDGAVDELQRRLGLSAAAPEQSDQRRGSLRTQMSWLESSIKRAKSLIVRTNSAGGSLLPNSPRKSPKADASITQRIAPEPTLNASKLLYQDTLYMVSGTRWGPVEVLRKMNAWIDQAAFRCMGTNARVRGLELPLHLVRAVLPFEQHKRFSIFLHDDSVHTFRVMGTSARDSAEKMRVWVDMIGRSSAILQRRLAAGTSGRPSPTLLHDASPSGCSDASFGLFGPALSTPLLEMPPPAPGRRSDGADKAVRDDAQAAISAAQVKVHVSGKTPVPAGLPPGLPTFMPGGGPGGSASIRLGDPEAIDVTPKPGIRTRSGNEIGFAGVAPDPDSSVSRLDLSKLSAPSGLPSFHQPLSSSRTSISDESPRGADDTPASTARSHGLRV